ncbi:MAG: hypothetical protein ABI311_12690 [Gemmatimonadaceae bacterium]
MREAAATASSTVAAQGLSTDRQHWLTDSDSTARSQPVVHDADGDDPVGRVIVYPLVILAAIVLIAATVGVVSLATGHH